jgi:regulatory protein
MMKKREITEAEAILKLEQYCGFQERCLADVRTRLYSLGVTGVSAEKILLHLQEEGFLDEERFARTFARSKFRQNHWGKVRISMEMKKRRIPARLIALGLEEIEETAYSEKIQSLYQQKLASLPPGEPDSKYKAIQFLIQKGYEMEAIKEQVQLK